MLMETVAEVIRLISLWTRQNREERGESCLTVSAVAVPFLHTATLEGCSGKR